MAEQSTIHALGWSGGMIRSNTGPSSVWYRLERQPIRQVKLGE